MEAILSGGPRALAMPRSERVLAAAFFVAATALGAQVAIPLPFTPVPVTLQTLFVLLGAATLGARPGAGCQAVYLALGASGLPLFAAGFSGAATAGYLLGFVPAALLVGRYHGSCASAASRFALFAAASLAILLCGALWLAFALHLNVWSALWMGVLPFLPGDLAKCAMASAITGRLAEARRVP